MVVRNVYLRLDSSTEQAPIRKLLPGERLTILDPTPDDGYYHAATDDQEEGWSCVGKNSNIAMFRVFQLFRV